MTNKTLKQLVPQEVCLSCDGCCRFSCDVSEWRPKADNKGEICEMYVDCIDESQYLKVEKEGDVYKCALLDLNTNKCLIYDDRPFECRLYPFLIIKEDKGFCVSVHLGCPFIQEVLDTEVFNLYIKTLKQYFKDEQVKKFIQKNIHLAGEYKDYKKEIKRIFSVVF